MAKIYKTKKRKDEFAAAYRQIGTLNQYILEYDIEIECHIRNGNFDEAIGKQKTVNEMKLELLELGKQGWDISYTYETVSGLELIRETPKLT